MKKILRYGIWSLGVIGSLWFMKAYGDFPNADKQFLEIKNLLLNPGFEQSLSKWDKFGTVGSSLNTTPQTLFVANGAASASYDATVTGQYLGSSLVTIPAGLFGKTCLGKFSYKGGDSSLTYQIVDGTGTVLGSSVLTVQARYSDGNVSFSCPTSGSFGVRIAATGNAAAVYLDDFYLGQDWRIQSSTVVLPTVQKFTSGTGTYTLPGGVKYIHVKMVGGGGGGGAQSANAGSTGGDSTFGSLTGAGGVGGAASSGNGGAGGTATLGMGSGLAISGGSGASSTTNPGTNIALAGGSGGASAFGGGGFGGSSGGVSGSAPTNSGAGGGGASGANSVPNGAGGGAGGSIDAIVTTPSATYSYGVGAAGAGGTAGGLAGGSGGSGVILVEEYYQ